MAVGFKGFTRFTIFSIAFGNGTDVFTREEIVKAIKDNKLGIEESEVDKVIDHWLDTGVVFDDGTKYVKNGGSQYAGQVKG